MQTLDDRLLIHLIDRIYDAATDASKWAEVAKSLASAFQARFSTVFGFSPINSSVLYGHSWGLPAEVFASYENTYAALDIRMPAALRESAGTVVTDESLIDRTVYRASPIYNEYLQPLECGHLMAVLPENTAGTRVIVSINRSDRVGAFDAKEREFLGRLVPHLQRAVLVSAKLVTAANAERLSLEIMGKAHFGICVLSLDGRVLETNSVARDFLSAKDSIAEVDGRFTAVDRVANDRLQQAISNMARFLVYRTDIRPFPIRAPSTVGTALRVLLVPLNHTQVGLDSTVPLLVAFVFRRSNEPRIHPSALSQVYGITPAEARVAAKLAEGYTVAETAQLLSISIETVRTHVKRILTKTDCESQSALVREILLGPGRLL